MERVLRDLAGLGSIARCVEPILDAPIHRTEVRDMEHNIMACRIQRRIKSVPPESSELQRLVP